MDEVFLSLKRVAIECFDKGAIEESMSLFDIMLDMHQSQLPHNGCSFEEVIRVMKACDSVSAVKVLVQTSGHLRTSPGLSLINTSISSPRFDIAESESRIRAPRRTYQPAVTEGPCRFPNYDGVIPDIDSVLRYFNMDRTIMKKCNGQNVKLDCTQVFVNIEARDAFLLKRGYSFGITSRNDNKSYISRWLYCRYRSPLNLEDVKHELCRAPAYEMLLNDGLVLFFEAQNKEHSHAVNVPPRGLSKELKRAIHKDSQNIYSSRDILLKIRSSGIPVPFSDRQILNEARKNTLLSERIVTGEDKGKLLSKWLAELNDDQLIARCITYRVDQGPCVIFTCKDWMSHLFNLDTWFFDGSFVKTKDSDVHVLTLVGRNAHGRIIPLVFATSYDESILTIRIFFQVIFDELAKAAGFCPRREDNHYIFPNLRQIMADGIPGLSSLIDELFGPGVERLSCFFHTLQSLTRWMTAEKIPDCAQQYVRDAMQYFSLAENLPQFLIFWADFSTLMLHKSEEGQEWSRLPDILKHMERTLILNSDTNHWCRALHEKGLEMSRAARSTVSESFNASFKRLLTLLPESKITLERELLQKILPQLIVRYRKEPYPKHEISRELWEQAVLLRFLVLQRPLRISDNGIFCYHFLAGFFHDLPNKDSQTRLTWKTDKNDWSPKVEFRNCAALRLPLKGFCVIRCSENLSVPRSYLKARCTCRQYLDNAHVCCVHILTLHLLLCPAPAQEDMNRFAAGDDRLRQLILEQKQRELSLSPQQLFPNNIGYGREFVHHILTEQAHKIDREREAAEHYLKQTLRGDAYVVSELECSSITKLLQEMEENSIRQWITYDNRYGQRSNRELPYKIDTTRVCSKFKPARPKFGPSTLLKPTILTKRKVQKKFDKKRGHHELKRDLEEIGIYGKLSRPSQRYCTRSNSRRP